MKRTITFDSTDQQEAGVADLVARSNGLSEDDVLMGLITAALDAAGRDASIRAFLDLSPVDQQSAIGLVQIKPMPPVKITPSIIGG